MWSIQNSNRSLVRKRTFVDNLNFIMASFTYIAANAIDYLLTIPGVENDAFREGNPLLREYIVSADFLFLSYASYGLMVL